MKHTKTFENYLKEDMYWIVDTSNRFDVAMFKLNMKQKNIDIFNRIFKSINDKNVYIFYSKSKDWFLCDIICERSNIYIEEQHYKYMGKLEITQKDIDDYELHTAANKYNL